MRAALASAGKLKSQIDVFMDTGHGFFADYRPSYDEADAKARLVAHARMVQEERRVTTQSAEIES